MPTTNKPATCAKLLCAIAAVTTAFALGWGLSLGNVGTSWQVKGNNAD